MKKLLLNLAMLLVAVLCGGVAYGTETEIKSWDFTQGGTVTFGTETVKINNMLCTYCTGYLEGLALQGSATYTLRSTDGLSQGNGDRYIAVLDLKKDDKVVISSVSPLKNPQNGTGETLVGENCQFTVSADGAFGIAFTKRGNSTLTYWVKKISVYRDISDNVCTDPVAKVVGVSSTKRIIQLSCETPDATIYYSTTQLETTADGWTQYSDNITTDAATIYAYAKTSTATSQVVTIATGAGKEIKLNTPTITKTAYSDGKYTVSFSTDVASLEVVPTSYSYSYSIDGGEAQTGSTASVKEGSTIKVYTQAEGYANSEEQTCTTAVRPASTTNVWSQDYTNVVTSGTGAQAVAFASDKAFSCNNRNFYNITAYATTDINVNKNVGFTNSKNLYLRKNGNNSGILQNGVNDEYIGIQNLSAGQIILITTNANALEADYGVEYEEGMSTTSEYYFKATGTEASIYFPKGTYNYVKTITVMTENKTISLPTTHTYSTFCSDVDLDFTGVTGVEAYKVKVNGSVAVTTKVEGKVKAGEGLLLKRIEGAESVVIPTTTGAAALEDNDLVGATEAISTWTDKNAYMLASDTKFQKIGEGTLAKGKAYLKVDDTKAASLASIYFGDIEGGDTVTAINGIADNAPAQADAIYTLQGVKVEKAEKGGIYIINGKKYIK